MGKTFRASRDGSVYQDKDRHSVKPARSYVTTADNQHKNNRAVPAAQEPEADVFAAGYVTSTVAIPGEYTK